MDYESFMQGDYVALSTKVVWSADMANDTNGGCVLLVDDYVWVVFLRTHSIVLGGS